MTPEQFEICKDFHLELIRPTPIDDTIAGAKQYLIDGIELENKSDQRPISNFLDKIKNRFESLKEWSSADSNTKYINIYNKKNVNRNPSDSVFYAVFQVMNGGTMMGAMKDHGVNYQSIKVLKKRIERWKKYSKMLNETL